MSDIETPELLDGAGLTLWGELTDALDFGPHELPILVELCRTVSLCERLEQQLQDDGLVLDGERGPKVNPVAAELRQQRIVVARLVASLGIPPLDDEKPAAKPRGAARGVYVPQVQRS